MRKLLLPVLILLFAGCSTDYPVRRIEQPVNVTHEVAFGDYRRVYNTAYHILNRYGVVQKASYRYGEINALVSEDTSLFDKTRTTIQARIFDAGDYWDVECRVLIAVEDSEPATFQDQFHPPYNWKTIASDQNLEVRLNNEIRAALSGGAWQAKEPLRPKATSPAVGPVKKKNKKKKSKKKASEDEGEVSTDGPEQIEEASVPSSEAFERLGILRMQRGSFVGAAKAFQAGLEANPNQARFGHFLLSQALFSQGEFTASQESMRQGVQANPEWVQADVDLREFYGPGNDTFAMRLGELTTNAQKDAALDLLLGYMRYHSEDAQGALQAFDRYLATHPESDVARTYRGLARQRIDAAHGVEGF